MSVEQEAGCTKPGGESGVDHRSSLLIEAAAILARMQQTASTLPPDAGASHIEALLRDIHSYKSLIAFARLDQVVHCVTEFEKYLSLLWQGRLPVDAAALSLVERAVGTLALMHASTMGYCQVDCSAIAEEVRTALAASTGTQAAQREEPRTSQPAPAEVRLATAQVDAAKLAEIEALASTSSRLLRRLEDASAFPRDERTEMMRLALDGTLQRLQQLAHSCHCSTLHDLFAPAAELVADMAAQYGKYLRVTLDVEAIDIELSLAQALRPAVMHIFRNAVAHGIETAEDRLAAGKAVEAVVSVSARQAGDRLLIVVHDDGRGFDTEALKRAAVAMGAMSPERSAMLSEEESVALAYMPGMSTANGRTDLSGTGMGLSSVARDLASIGGSMHVETERGIGTTVTLELPLRSTP